MARSDTEQLVVSLEARIRDFEKNMAKANRTAGTSFTAMERRAAQAGKRMEASMTSASAKIGSSLKALGSGLVAGLAIGGIDQIVTRLGEVAEGVANIGNEARRAGLSTKVFQELSHVATQTRVPIDALIDGFKELAIRGDEFATTGAGGGADAFKRLGFSASDLARKLKDPSALFLEIIGRMQKLDEAAQKRIQEDLFGGEGGEQFAEFLRVGEAGIRSMITEANAFGLVMDDAFIAKADEADRAFKLVTATVGTGLKMAIINAISALDDFITLFNGIENQKAKTLRVQIAANFQDQAGVQDRIAGLREEQAGSPFPNLVEPQVKLAEAELAKLRTEYERLQKALDTRLYGDPAKPAGDSAKDAAPKVSTLSTAVSGLSGAGTTGASGVNTFADAIRDLKDEIPGLTDQLADLDKRTRIEGAYKGALQKARSIGDTIVAERLKNEALASLDVQSATNNPSAFLKSRLRSGQSAQHVEGLSSDLSTSLAEMLASAPEAIRASIKINSGFRSFERQAQLWEEALKKYGSPEAARKWVAPPGRSMHNAGNAADLGFGTDEARNWTHENAGKFGLTFPMAHEPWHIEPTAARREKDDEDARTVFDAKTADSEARLDEAKQQAAAYAEIVAGAKAFTTEQTAEAAALNMTAQQAAKLRYEQEFLNEAQRSGIALSPAQRQELANLAAGMAEVEAATAKAATAQDDMREVQGFLKGQVGGFFQSIISGSSSVEDALGKLLGSLADAALQAALLGSGPLAGLMGGGGGILSAVMGFSKGGVVKAASGGHIRGPGTGTSDSIPAALSNGEFVVRAAATRKHRALLEAINAGNLPAFAAGGIVGSGAVTRPTAHGGTSSQSITIAPVINMNAKGGSEKENADAARQTAKAVEVSVRAIVAQELRQASRPGGRDGFR